MSRLKTLALAAVPVAAFSPAVLVAQPSAPLSQVSQHLKAVTTMTANFTQTDRRGQSMSGTMILKRPGHIRFQYQPSAKLLILGDGRRLNMIDYETGRKESWPIGNSPLTVLLNPNQDLSRFAKVVPNTDTRVVLVQARDPRRPEFGTITIAFAKVASAPAGLMLQGWTVVDAQNNQTIVKLNNQRFNVPVSNGAFQYVEPRRGPRG
jgi:outer membrane lipoprotein-sorting protein